MEYKTTQREIKRLIKAGAAIELTDTKTVNAGRLQTVALSFGIYGMNSGLYPRPTFKTLFKIVGNSQYRESNRRTIQITNPHPAALLM